jgi:hypothetical protein
MSLTRLPGKALKPLSGKLAQLIAGADFELHLL